MTTLNSGLASLKREMVTLVDMNEDKHEIDLAAVLIPAMESRRRRD